ncbi:class I SAM-dependent methyltransferase [Halostella pelagica]|uniref:class I SAM-dependent methyltransferase n=1 Tax=Halostella pelagica TaxID=2583824 RepID=UPI001F3B74AD|nr:class I SAM-dependent methyltransferase [Halostella pelagica]
MSRPMAPTDVDPFTSTEVYYARYRPGYGGGAIEYLQEKFDLDESSRVLDLGCGAGQITVPIAAFVGKVVGMDPNQAMIREAQTRAAEAGRDNIEWVVGSDSDLDEDLVPVRLTTMGRSFHWMDQERTLERLRSMTEPGGGVAILNDAEWFTRGEKRWQDEVYEIADEYIDDLPPRTGPVDYDDPWDEKLDAFGFHDVEVATFETEREWDVDSVVGYVFSLSYCSPETFGDEQEAFERDLRARLTDSEREPFVQRAETEVIAGRKQFGGIERENSG